MLPITAITASILALMFVALTFNVIRNRLKYQVALGDKSEPAMMRAIRVHGNFAEYVPIALILMGLAEGAGAHTYLTCGAATLLILGRMAHAGGVLNESKEKPVHRGRQIGMFMTLTAIIALSIGNLYLHML